jgi:hypothetical protein
MQQQHHQQQQEAQFKEVEVQSASFQQVREEVTGGSVLSKACLTLIAA